MEAQRINFQNQDIFVSGVNMPWNEFGWDFGNHHLWGNGYDSTYFEQAFQELEISGINTVRMWVHCDGRANPNFDKNGFVTGLDDNFLDELNDFLHRAQQHHILVILTLWSHDMLENEIENAGEFAGMHQELITDDAKLQSYLDFALTPMVQALSHHCNLLAYEIISEPEWCFPIIGVASTSQLVNSTHMQRFVAKCIQVIRANSSQYVTVGSAYPCGNDYAQNKNYWHETEFEALGFNCNEVYLDFYSFHYFEWMGDDDDVFQHHSDNWDMNKPILIAESATYSSEKTMLKTAKTQLQHVFEKQYAGVLFWSYNAQDEYSSWSDFKNEVTDFNIDNANEVNINLDCDTSFQYLPTLICSFYPNPVQEILKLNYNTSADLDIVTRIYNSKGSLVQNFELALLSENHQIEFSLSSLQQGLYFLEVWQKNNEQFFKVFTEKIIKL